MSASIAVGLSLAVVLIAIGALFGVGAAYLWRARRRLNPPAVPAEPTVLVTGAMGLDQLARLVTVLERLEPSATHEVVNEMTEPAVLSIYLRAALAILVGTPGMPSRVRAVADEMVAQALWEMPTADRPPGAGV